MAKTPLGTLMSQRVRVLSLLPVAASGRQQASGQVVGFAPPPGGRSGLSTQLLAPAWL